MVVRWSTTENSMFERSLRRTYIAVMAAFGGSLGLLWKQSGRMLWFLSVCNDFRGDRLLILQRCLCCRNGLNIGAFIIRVRSTDPAGLPWDKKPSISLSRLHLMHPIPVPVAPSKGLQAQLPPAIEFRGWENGRYRGRNDA